MTTQQYKIIEQYNDGALIELERFCAFDWVYLAADGSVDIGKTAGDHIMHTVFKFQSEKGVLGPEKVRVRITIEPATFQEAKPRSKEAERWRKVGDTNENDS